MSSSVVFPHCFDRGDNGKSRRDHKLIEAVRMYRPQCRDMTKMIVHDNVLADCDC